MGRRRSGCGRTRRCGRSRCGSPKRGIGRRRCDASGWCGRRGGRMWQWRRRWSGRRHLASRERRGRRRGWPHRFWARGLRRNGRERPRLRRRCCNRRSDCRRNYNWRNNHGMRNNRGSDWRGNRFRLTHRYGCGNRRRGLLKRPIRFRRQRSRGNWSGCLINFCMNTMVHRRNFRDRSRSLGRRFHLPL
jgi:hypothetical protein